MDRLHRVDECGFISKPVDVAAFLEEARAAHDAIYAANFATDRPPAAVLSSSSSAGGQTVTDEKKRRLLRSATTRARLGLGADHDRKLYLTIRKRCHRRLLLDGTELPDELITDGLIPRRHKLESLRLLDAHSDRRRSDGNYSQQATLRLRTRKVNYRMLDDGRAAALAHWSASDCKPFYPTDVVLRVHACKPYNRPLTREELREETCYEVLGSTPLVALADAIACLSDYAVADDQSQHSMYLDQEHAVFAKERFKSRYLFFGDTFYNDLSDPSAIDLSEDFRRWAAGRRSGDFDKFHTGDMRAARFVDLQRVRLGRPYVYVHQACCEHLLVVSQIRLMTPDDHPDPTVYPRQINYTPNRQAACCGCSIATARWAVHGGSRLPMDPAFFCDTCYRAFNFDDKGNKLGSFMATPYIDKTALK